MSARTRRLMKVFRRKLTKLIEKENGHFGDPDLIREAKRFRDDIEEWLENEVENLEPPPEYAEGGRQS